MAEKVHILEPLPRVHAALPSRPHGPSAPLPQFHGVLHPVEVLVVDPPVVQLLLGVGGVDRIRHRRLGHFGVADEGRYAPLEDGNPVLPHPLALHRLGPPQHRRGYGIAVGVGSLEQLPQERLLPSPGVGPNRVGVHHLSRGIDAHGQSGELRVKERNPRLQPMGHGHAVGPVKVDVAQHAVDPPEFVLELAGGTGVLEVQVPGEQLVGPLSRQDHLDVRCSALGQEPVGYGGAYELGLIRFHVVHDLGDEIEHLLRGEGADVVVHISGPSQGFRHGPCGHDVGAVLHANGVSRYGPVVARLLSVKGQKVVRDDAGINTPGQEEAIVNVGHHSLLDGLGEGLPNLIIRDMMTVLLPGGIVVIHEPLRLIIAHDAGLRTPIMPRRQRHHRAGIHVSHQRLQLRRKHVRRRVALVRVRTKRPSVVQRLDPHGIPRRERLHLPRLVVLLEDHEREHPVQEGRGLRSAVTRVGVRDDLAVRSGEPIVRPRTVQAVLAGRHGLVQLVVVVNLAVRRQVDRLAHRVEFQIERHVGVAVGGIDDGEAGVTHRPPRLQGPLTTTHDPRRHLHPVRTAVVKHRRRAGHHGLVVQYRDVGPGGLGRAENVVDRGDEAAHAASGFVGGVTGRHRRRFRACGG
mmetsp:Transcript_18351/g.37188  ORF Transcript_18351/g.37188 Transcript_18351/m.37188 type:complete len:631 (+) Transcript_18351:879-2771(+)